MVRSLTGPLVKLHMKYDKPDSWARRVFSSQTWEKCDLQSLVGLFAAPIASLDGVQQSGPSNDPVLGRRATNVPKNSSTAALPSEDTACDPALTYREADIAGIVGTAVLPSWETVNIIETLSNGNCMVSSIFKLLNRSWRTSSCRGYRQGPAARLRFDGFRSDMMQAAVENDSMLDLVIQEIATM